MKKIFLSAVVTLALNPSMLNANETNLYWVDTHLHTNNSGDAYFLGNKTADPDTAYRMDDFNTPKILSSVWGEIADAADRHNNPGNFTAFIGWEWSSLPDGANLHRVIFMSEDAKVAKKFVPYSALDSDKPEDLWNWLETTSNKTGANFVAIAHNSNVSKGKMFNRATRMQKA